MVGRKKAVRTRYFELQQELEELRQLEAQLRLDGPKEREQYV